MTILAVYFIGMIVTFIIINHYNDTGIDTLFLFESVPILVGWPLYWVIVILVWTMQSIGHIWNRK